MSKIEELTSRKEELKNEISNLTERRNTAECEIEELKATLGSKNEPKDAESRISDLKNTRDTFQEVIDGKSKELESVIEELEPLELERENEVKKKELVKLANKADKEAENYHALKAELNEQITQTLNKLIAIRSEWKQSGEAFFRLANEITPGFTSGTYRKLDSTKEAEELLKEISERVDISTVTSTEVVNTQYFPYAGQGASPHSSKDLPFNHKIEQMINSEMDRQLRELQKKAS